MKPRIVINLHDVIIEDVVVPRPSRLSPLQWEEWWYDVIQSAGSGAFQRGHDLGFDEGYDVGYKVGSENSFIGNG